MSLENVKDISSDIDKYKNDAKKLIYSSIAMQGIGLSNILNAEGEMIKYIIKNNKIICSSSEMLKINESVEKIIDKINLIEKLLIEKIKIISDE